MLLHRATGDPQLLQAGADMVRSLRHSSRTPCGYATVRDVRDHRLEDRMESFFLAETTKYLYLLFDPGNWAHGDGEDGVLVDTGRGECVLYAGGYIFNTEAHPVDPAALACCSGIGYDLSELVSPRSRHKAVRGESLAERARPLQDAVYTELEGIK